MLPKRSNQNSYRNIEFKNGRAINIVGHLQHHTSVARRPPVLTGGGSASTPSNTFIIDVNPYKGNA